MSQTLAESTRLWNRKALPAGAHLQGEAHPRMPPPRSVALSRHRWPAGLVLALILGAPLARPASLTLLPGAGAPFDLAVSGMLAGVPAGETRHVRRSDLLALPSREVDVTGQFGNVATSAQALFLSDLLGALALDKGADLVMAQCSDGYLSVYPFSFIRNDRPFLVLQIQGTGPEHWPPAGLQNNPGPYAISVSDAVVPGVSGVRDIGHKEPWGVVSLRITSVAESFGGFYAGQWAHAGESVVAGREIWIHSCASCHPGPEGVAGGTKSGRPFPVVQAFASADPKFFKQYVRDPKSLMPGAKMEPHPHYTDAELDQLISFLVAKSPAS